MGTRICGVDDLEVGECGVFDAAGREFAVTRISETDFYALRNRCPHQGAPLGRGYLTGTFVPSEVGEYRWGREPEILRCPWHKYEFDTRTGRSLHDPAGCRVASYPLAIEGEDVVLQS
jgi:nitrite reductase (NADH) small subunit